jgi:hypothetical protein
MNEQLDKRISKILFGISGAIVLYWASLGQFCVNNLSIIIVVYLIICLQVAGLAEFRFRKNFLKAFLLGIVITPPLMMICWGRHSE